MNKKTKLILITTMVSLLLFASNFTTSQAVLGSWDVGTTITVTEYYNNIAYSKDNVENVDATTQTQTAIIWDINITSINNITGDVYYDEIDPSGAVSSFSDEYFMNDVINDYADLLDIFVFDYRYDQGRNQTVLYMFDIVIDFLFFIEANWTVYNNHFDSVFNSSFIVDTVTDPYNGSITYDITFGDFLASCRSFSINGQDTLSAAKQTFTSSNTGLEISIDVGGVRHRRTWNGTAGYYNYFAYDEYTIENAMNFDSGGIIKKYLYRSLIGQTSGDESSVVLGISYIP